MKTKETTKRVTVSIAVDIFNRLPSQQRVAWIREAIAEKLQRESQSGLSPAESKAVERITNPIKEEEWVTVGTIDEEFDLEQVNREIKERGYMR